MSDKPCSEYREDPDFDVSWPDGVCVCGWGRFQHEDQRQPGSIMAALRDAYAQGHHDEMTGQSRD